MQEQVRLVVQQVALYIYGFQVRVHGVPPAHAATVPRWPGPPLLSGLHKHTQTHHSR